MTADDAVCLTRCVFLYVRAYLCTCRSRSSHFSASALFVFRPAERCQGYRLYVRCQNVALTNKLGIATEIGHYKKNTSHS